MPSDPIFSLTRNDRPLASVALDAVAPAEAGAPVSELQYCGAQVSPREADIEYSLLIGDIEPDLRGSGGAVSDPALGRVFGPNVLWENAAYFESSRGLVVVSVRSRALQSSESWRLRARIRVVVVPSKVGEARYLGMFEQLRALAAGLLFDLLSKMARDVHYAPVVGSRASHRSSQLELNALAQTWRVIARGLYEIERDPVLRLIRTARTRPSWGAQTVRPNAICRLAAAGIDVRSPHTPRPVPVLQAVLEESADTTEHRILAGFMALLARRALDCGRNAAAQISRLEEQRAHRDVRIDPGPTLYELYDRPRIEKLRDAVRSADELLGGLRRAARLSFLRDIRPAFGPPRTPVFDHVAPYHRIRSAMHDYLRSSVAILDDGDSERIKSTGRLYEHWVFFQLVAAFRSAGLSCEDLGGLLRRLGSERFTLDLDERAQVVMRSSGGRRVIVRYEPWILPREAARQAQQAVCRGKAGSTAWRPDILIEFRSTDSIDYAVVVDAKYSREIRDEHWAATTKYAEIRAVDGGQQVVRQVWLAYPNAGGIACRDPAVTWTEHGPDRPQQESILGTIALRPPEFDPDIDAPIVDIEPEQTARIFAAGLLRYLGYIDH
ncbi:hypothetical protein KF840_02685 [bacterium]|nr:hypothetical protein [bacterium]